MIKNKNFFMFTKEISTVIYSTKPANLVGLQPLYGWYKQVTGNPMTTLSK